MKGLKFIFTGLSKPPRTISGIYLEDYVWIYVIQYIWVPDFAYCIFIHIFNCTDEMEMLGIEPRTSYVQ